jgi:hypothetical protein
MRRILRQQLIKAWDRSIGQDYRRFRIYSERSLQASFWARLNKLLPAATRRLFVEPRIVVDGVVYFPDLAICNSREVIAIIELKYQPRVPPSHDKDLNTLKALARNRKKLHLVAERYRGNGKFRKDYVFATNVLFVWAGVHSIPTNGTYENPDGRLLSEGCKDLEGCFLQLHAETSALDKPNIFSRH